MPTNVVKTPADEEKWEKAKAQAAKQGKAENYAYIMGIYKSMNPDKFKSAQRVAARYRSANLTSKRLEELGEIINVLSQGFPDHFRRPYLEYGDTSDLEKALGRYRHQLEGLRDKEKARLEEEIPAEREYLRLKVERTLKSVFPSDWSVWQESGDTGSWIKDGFWYAQYGKEEEDADVAAVQRDYPKIMGKAAKALAGLRKGSKVKRSGRGMSVEYPDIGLEFSINGTDAFADYPFINFALSLS